MKKNTKIIATIGPACSNKTMLQEMVDIGVNVFRLNMSHGNSESKQKLYNLIKSIKSPQGKRPSILTDLAGPKIRITDVKKDLILFENQSIQCQEQHMVWGRDWGIGGGHLGIGGRGIKGGVGEIMPP